MFKTVYLFKIKKLNLVAGAMQVSVMEVNIKCQ